MYRSLTSKIVTQLIDGSPYKIAFIGDSITSAEWVHPNWRSIFEYILKFELGINTPEFNGEKWWIPEWNLKFYNYSLDGASSANFVENVDIAIKEVHPDLFIIMGTANDASLGLTVENQVQNLRTIFEKLVSEKIACVYTPDIYSSLSKQNENHKPYVEAVMKLTQKYQTNEDFTFFNAFEKFAQYDISKFYTLQFPQEEQAQYGMMNDPVHPNALGNVYIAKMFLEEAFGIDVDADAFMGDVKSGIVKYPRWK